MPSDPPIEVMFLQQQGNDPFTPVPERIAQANSVASRIARFIGQARSTLDIAIYDFRLQGDPSSIVSEAIRDRAKAGVAVRILFDAAYWGDAALAIPDEILARHGVHRIEVEDLGRSVVIVDHDERIAETR